MILHFNRSIYESSFSQLFTTLHCCMTAFECNGWPQLKLVLIKCRDSELIGLRVCLNSSIKLSFSDDDLHN